MGAEGSRLKHKRLRSLHGQCSPPSELYISIIANRVKLSCNDFSAEFRLSFVADVEIFTGGRGLTRKSKVPSKGTNSAPLGRRSLIPPKPPGDNGREQFVY
jgi:hypothetical protein